MKILFIGLLILISIYSNAEDVSHLVSYRPDVNIDKELSKLQKNSEIKRLEVVSRAPLLVSIYLVEPIRNIEALTQLKQNQNIKFIEKDFEINIPDSEFSFADPNDSKFKKQWAFNAKKKGFINIKKTWLKTIGSKNIKVAVLDTGVDYNHKDLVANVWVNQKEKNGQAGIDDDGNGFIDDVYGYDFINNDNDPIDDEGHGTHVAGVIGATGDNNIGIAGTAWDVTLINLKIARSDRSGRISSAIKAMDYAMKQGAQIINMSFGSYNYSQAFYDKLVEAQKRNILVVSGAGNDNKDIDKNPFYPAAYNLDNIISVASNTSSAKKSNFSSYGKYNVDLFAPGSSIYSTLPGNRYGTDNGTSFATPYVSGAAVLLMSLNPGASYGSIKNKILRGARPHKGLDKYTQTGGVLDVYNSVK